MTNDLSRGVFQNGFLVGAKLLFYLNFEKQESLSIHCFLHCLLH